MRTFPSKTYGSVSESLCAAYYSNLGYIVSKPISEDSRYDFLIDDGDSIKKVQCKTAMGKPAKRHPSIDMVSKSRKKGYSKGDFDILWILTNYGVYLIDASDIKVVDGKYKSFVLTPKYNAYLIDLPFLKEQEPKRRYSAYITDVEKSRIVSLAKLGVPHRAIALAMGIRKRHIELILEGCHVITRPFVTDDMKKEIVKMHNIGIPVSIMSDVTGLCAQHINSCLRECGINKRPRRGKLSQDVKEQAYQMRLDGVPFSEIVESLCLQHDREGN